MPFLFVPTSIDKSIKGDFLHARPKTRKRPSHHMYALRKVVQKINDHVPVCPYLKDRNLHQVVSIEETQLYTQGPSSQILVLWHANAI